MKYVTGLNQVLIFYHLNFSLYLLWAWDIVGLWILPDRLLSLHVGKVCTYDGGAF
jgi:hypothetical protein